MNDQELLESKARFYCERLWGMELDIPVIYNGRMKSRLGSFYIGKGKPEKIEINKKLLNGKYNAHHLDDVLIHELCHWYCEKTGKMSCDGSTDFENELKRMGVHSTRQYETPDTYYTANCSACEMKCCKTPSKKLIERWTAGGYLSKCCRAKLIRGKDEWVFDKFEASPRLEELVFEFWNSQYSTRIS